MAREDIGPIPLGNYKGFWCLDWFLPNIMAASDLYNFVETDLLLACQHKSGSTWLKILAFATLNRKQHHPSSPNHPLLHVGHPHDVAPTVEVFQDISRLDTPPPRLLATHMAYSLLPASASTSGCRIIYICRDPKDNFVSFWHFLNELTPETMEPVPFDKAFGLFCKGISVLGPVWEHMLEYWKESLRRPDKILFLKYEDVMEDTAGNVRKMAEFMGLPFSQEEESCGIVEEIVRLCSFDNMKGLDVNKMPGQSFKTVVVKNSSLFRKGKVGDWKNHLTLDMARKLDEISVEKFRGSGLSFGNVEST